MVRYEIMKCIRCPCWGRPGVLWIKSLGSCSTAPKQAPMFSTLQGNVSLPVKHKILVKQKTKCFSRQDHLENKRCGYSNWTWTEQCFGSDSWCHMIIVSWVQAYTALLQQLRWNESLAALKSYLMWVTGHVFQMVLNDKRASRSEEHKPSLEIHSRNWR